MMKYALDQRLKVPKENHVQRYGTPVLVVVILAMTTLNACAKLESLKARVASWTEFRGKDQKAPSDTDSKKSSQTTQGSEPSNDYEYFQIKTGNLRDSRTVRGKLQPSERVEIRADRRVRIGPAKMKLYANVKKGDVIFEVDSKDLVQKQLELKERFDQVKVDLQSAKSQLTFAQKQFDRKKALSKKGIAPTKELEEAEKQLDQATTAIQTKTLDLRKAEREMSVAAASITTANIVAPLAGVVSTVVPGGDEVNQGQVLVTISDTSKLALMVQVDDTLVTKIPVGFEVDVTIDAVPGKKLKGVVAGSTPSGTSGQSLVKTYDLKVQFSDDQIKGLNLKDGFEATLTATFKSRDNVLTTPLGALRFNGSDGYLLVASAMGGRASARPVKIGIKTEHEAEIVDGVKLGEFALVVPKEAKKP
jgi:macrolide-specific efflux system membrane fusion protein